MTHDAPSLELQSEYSPVALYFHDADVVEYVREDASCIYKRIDETLTLAIEMDSELPIGFRIKGFRNFYLKSILPHRQGPDHFVQLVPVLEQLVEEAAARLNFPDLRRAYQIASDIAGADNPQVDVEAIAA